MIELKNIYKSYGEKKVIENFSYKFEAGDKVAIIADSGKGKTTLLRIITGIEHPDEGYVISDKNLSIAMVFQENRLCEEFSVWENLFLVNEKLLKSDVKKMLAEIDLENEIDSLLRDLSGGMKRRVAIMRALIFEGQVIIMDEPIKALDVETKNKVISFINKNIAGKTFILVTHNMDEIKDFHIDKRIDLLRVKT